MSRNQYKLAFEHLELRLLWSASQVIGVQSAALDQPRINAYLSRTPTGDPLTDSFGFDFFNIDAFFDTGASGVLLSASTSEFLEVNNATSGGSDVIFSDVGVGGSDDFLVSEQLYLHLAKYHPNAQVDDLDFYDIAYPQQIGPVRAQMGPIAENPNPLLEGLDVIGMPAMAGKVIVMDPKPVDSFADTMRTYVYNPGTAFDPAHANDEPGIPSTNVQIPLSYVNFDSFTTVTPAGAPGPTLRNNPFIGRNPFVPGDTHAQPLSSYNGQTSSGNWLLDTGAAASIISQARAAELGVTYAPGSYGSDNPQLLGIAPGTQTFSLTIGGIGGTIQLMGFFMESLLLPTTDGQGLEYVGAPVLIGDITLFDPGTNQPYTLDGIFGMNYLVASANIEDGGIFPIPVDLTIGAYDWITFDEPNGILGLQLRDAVPAPAVTDHLFEHDASPNAFYFQFGRNVSASLSLSDLQVQNLTTGQTIASAQMSLAFDPSLNTATLNFPGVVNANGILPDGNYRVRVVAAGVEDQFGIPMAGDAVLDFFSLAGDADRDRAVDLDDFTSLAANFGQQDRIWAQGDFTLDGSASLDDFTILASNFGKNLPPPQPASGRAALLAAAPGARSPFTVGSLLARLRDVEDEFPL